MRLLIGSLFPIMLFVSTHGHGQRVMPYIKECKAETDAKARESCTYNKMYKHLETVHEYPIYCKVNKISGTVHVGFTITTKGRVQNVKVEQTLHPMLDEVAVKMVKTLSKFKWVPGREYGKKANVRYKIPVSFALK